MYSLTHPTTFAILHMQTRDFFEKHPQESCRILSFITPLIPGKNPTKELHAKVILQEFEDYCGNEFFEFFNLSKYLDSQNIIGGHFSVFDELKEKIPIFLAIQRDVCHYVPSNKNIVVEVQCMEAWKNYTQASEQQKVAYSKAASNQAFKLITQTNPFQPQDKERFNLLLKYIDLEKRNSLLTLAISKEHLGAIDSLLESSVEPTSEQTSIVLNKSANFKKSLGNYLIHYGYTYEGLILQKPSEEIWQEDVLGIGAERRADYHKIALQFIEDHKNTTEYLLFLRAAYDRLDLEKDAEIIDRLLRGMVDSNQTQALSILANSRFVGNWSKKINCLLDEITLLASKDNPSEIWQKHVNSQKKTYIAQVLAKKYASAKEQLIEFLKLFNSQNKNKDNLNVIKAFILELKMHITAQEIKELAQCTSRWERIIGRLIDDDTADPELKLCFKADQIKDIFNKDELYENLFNSCEILIKKLPKLLSFIGKLQESEENIQLVKTFLYDLRISLLFDDQDVRKLVSAHAPKWNSYVDAILENVKDDLKLEQKFIVREENEA